MFNSNENIQRNKPIIALSFIVLTFIILIITLSVTISTFMNHGEARIINQSIASTSNNSDLLSDEDISRIKKELYNHLEKTASIDSDFDAAIRWDTVKKNSGKYPSTTFLVDVDEYQQTYRVTIEPYIVNINCPDISESKYPSSYCIGNGSEGDNSTSVVFGELLPYTGETSEGEIFSLERPYINGIQYADTPDLNVYVSACSDTDAAKERARAAAEEYINSLGAPSDLFNLKVSLAGGCHGE